MISVVLIVKQEVAFYPTTDKDSDGKSRRVVQSGVNHVAIYDSAALTAFDGREQVTKRRKRQLVRIAV